MKRHIILYIVLVLLLAACGPTPSLPKRGWGNDATATQLALIDSLADVNPDSADVLLNSVAPLPTGERLRVGASAGMGQGVGFLLRIKVDDKLYRPITHYRDTILQLVDYFEQHPRVLPRLLGKTGPALPYLYAGRVFADLGDAPQALDYYQRALDVMPDGQIENGEWKIENGAATVEERRLAKQRGLLHSLIGETFFFQGLYKEAVASLKDANRYAIFAGDTLDQIFNFRDIAEEYKFMNMNDSSLLFYEQALLLAQQSSNTRMCNDVMSQLASLYNEMGDYKTAMKYIQPALNHIDTACISAVYSIAAKCYSHLQQGDSARYFINKLLTYGNLYGKRYAYQELANLAIKKNAASEAWHYFQQYRKLTDSIRSRDNAETVARMHAAYNYQKHEREAQKLREKNDRMHGYLLLSSSAVVVLLLLAGIVVLRRRYQRQLVLSSMGKTDLLRYTYEQKTEQQKSSERERVFASPIYAAIQSHLRSSGNAALNDDEWEQLHQTVNAIYPNFREKLMSLTAMNDHEYHVCLLLKIGIKPSDMAMLTAHSRESVTASRRRLYEKAMNKTGKPSDWDVLVTLF